MLEFVVSEQFEEQAKELIGQDAVRFAPRDRAKILADILTEFKGEEIAPKMSVYSVKYNEDGTTAVRPIDLGFDANEHTLLNFLQDSGQTVMINKEGRSICIAPFEVNSASYIRTFDPADAPTIRETMTAQLTEPKKPSFYDKVCDFFATRVLGRPGKAVKEYNDKKAFYDAMQKGLEKLTGIPEKVENYQQEHDEELRRIEQEQLQRQRELEEQQRIQQEREAERLKQIEEEAQRKAQEEAQRKAKEEAQRQQEQLQKEKEEHFAKFEPERNKARTEAEQKINEFRLKTVRDLQHSLPRKIRERDNLVTQQENLKKEIAEGEKNLNIVKTDLTKKEQLLERTQKDLTESKNTLKDLANDLAVWAKVKALQPQKIEQQRKLKAAEEAIPLLNKQLEEAKLEQKKAGDEYYKVAATGHIYEMKPKDYLEYNYNTAKAGREKMLEQDRAVLAAQMKAIEEQLQSRDLSKKEIESKQATWEKLPVLNWWSDSRAVLKTEDALRADLEKQYKALQKEDAEVVKSFNEREAQHKKLALDFSPENLTRTEEALKAGLADTKAKFDAYQNAGKRVEKLEEHLAYSRGDRSKATKELSRLNKETGNQEYDEARHNHTQELHDKLKEQVTSLSKQCATMNLDVSKGGQLVRNAEFELQQKKEELPKMETRYRNLDDEIDRGKAQLYNFTSQLHKAGIAVEPSPEMQQAQPQQPQAQQAQPQPQPQIAPR